MNGYPIVHCDIIVEKVFPFCVVSNNLTYPIFFLKASWAYIVEI